MAHISNVYNKKASCESRVRPDFERVVNVDENGDEHITWNVVDYPKIQSSLGSFRLWSLTSLASAGIDPRFPIVTGFNTRLGCLVQADNAVNVINSSIVSDKVE